MAISEAKRLARNERQRKWREKNPLYKVRDHGLTPADYEAMVVRQGGGCGICKGPPNGSTKRFHIDHDHNNGRVRGLLCMSCNLAIGYLKDDPSRAKAAAAYLEGKGVRTVNQYELKTKAQELLGDAATVVGIDLSDPEAPDAFVTIIVSPSSIKVPHVIELPGRPPARVLPRDLADKVLAMDETVVSEEPLREGLAFGVRKLTIRYQEASEWNEMLKVLAQEAIGDEAKVIAVEDHPRPGYPTEKWILIDGGSLKNPTEFAEVEIPSDIELSDDERALTQVAFPVLPEAVMERLLKALGADDFAIHYCIDQS